MPARPSRLPSMRLALSRVEPEGALVKSRSLNAIYGPFGQKIR